MLFYMKVSSLLFWNYSSDCKDLFKLVPAHFLGSCVIYFSNIVQAGMHVEFPQHCPAESVRGARHGQNILIPEAQLPNATQS